MPSFSIACGICKGFGRHDKFCKAIKVLGNKKPLFLFEIAVFLTDRLVVEPAFKNV